MVVGVKLLLACVQVAVVVVPGVTNEDPSIVAPVPGMLAGGPHNGGNDISATNCSNYLSSSGPALSYLDNVCSYATNEVAINWNAPFAYLSGFRI